MSAYTNLSRWYRRRGSDYVTTEPVSWDVFRLGSGMTVTVPVGFTFDMSVPRRLSWLVNPHDPRHLKAACLHDWLLKMGASRESAGAVFFEALKADGVLPVRAGLMALATVLWRRTWADARMS